MRKNYFSRDQLILLHKIYSDRLLKLAEEKYPIGNYEYQYFNHGDSMLVKVKGYIVDLDFCNESTVITELISTINGNLIVTGFTSTHGEFLYIASHKGINHKLTKI